MIDGAKSLFSMKLKQLVNHDSCGVCAIVNSASTAGHGKNSITKRHLHLNSNCCQCFSLATLLIYPTYFSYF